MLKNKTIKWLTITGVAFILALMPLYYFLRKAPVEIETVTKTIVSVDAPLKSGELSLRNLNSMLGMEFGNIADSVIAFGGYGEGFADKIIRTSVAREVFLERIGADTSILPREIIRDEKYQQFASLVPKKAYTLYVKVGPASDNTANNFTINGSKYPATFLQDDWYKVGQVSSEYTTGAVKADGNAIIQDALFVTGRSSLLLSERVEDDDLGIVPLRTAFNVGLPPNSYMVVALPAGVKLINKNSENLLGRPVELLCYEGGSNVWVRHLNALDPKSVFIITRPDDYLLVKENSLISPNRIVSAFLLGLILIYLVATNSFSLIASRLRNRAFFENILLKLQNGLGRRSLGTLLLMLGLLFASFLLTSPYWYLPSLLLFPAILIYSGFSRTILLIGCFSALAGTLATSYFEAPVLLGRMALFFYLFLILAAGRLWRDQLAAKNSDLSNKSSQN